MSDFGYKIHRATELLATGEGDVKNRLGLAVTDELIFANVPNDAGIPHYFRDKLRTILQELSTRTWHPDLEGDRVRATIHPMHFKTAAKYAKRIWDLHNEFREYERSGLIPGEELTIRFTGSPKPRGSR
jgi:hypothetical protein